MTTALLLLTLSQQRSAVPQRILLTWAGDPATTAAVTWRTEAPSSTGEGQIALADADPAFGKSARNVPANSENVDAGGSTVTYHTVRFTGLKPRTLYAYRVGSSDGWSEWIQFRTAADKPSPVSFIYFGDAQNDIKSLWSRAVRQAYRHEARADFMIHAGDLINLPQADDEWRDWFYAGGWVHSMVPSIAVPGNHEYGGGSLTRFWRPQFEYPRNGLPSLPDTNYFVDYQGVRIVALDSNREVAEQATWLDRVLSDRPQKWTVAVFHHPVFSTASGRDNPQIRSAWRPVLEKHNVALVLQGHDHTYGRRNVPTGVTATGGKSGTVYVVSVSGPKMYNVGDDAAKTMDKTGQRKQLYQVVRIDGDVLQYRAYLVTGELYDSFDLKKRADGKNVFVAH